MRIESKLFVLMLGVLTACRGEYSQSRLVDGSAEGGGDNAPLEPSSSPGSSSNAPSAPLSNPARLGKAVQLGVWHVPSSDGASPGDFAVYTNVVGTGSSLATMTSNAERAVVVFHDASRDALGNATAMLGALEQSKSDPSLASTLLLAPWYMAAASNWPSNMRPAMPVSWTSNDYIEGGMAENNGPSSYAVIDAMLAHLADKSAFPHLKAVTLAGHSAGGQTAQLYTVAMGPKSRVGNIVYPFDLATAIANPSSYPYPDNQRPSGNGFAPASTAGCSDVNIWKYGLMGIPATVSTSSASALLTAAVARHVTYALGEDDNNPNDPTMDQGCEAEAQGPTRLFRGQKYYEHLKALFPQSPHTLCLVPNVAHDTAAMLQSNCVTAVLFRSIQ